MEELRKSIQDGRMRPGERLLEAELATEFNVSRGCVREALRGLEREGLVVSLPYRETRVATTTEEEVVEVLLPIRVVIEIFVARRLVGHLQPEQVAILARVVESMRAAAAMKDTLQLSQLDIEFHRHLVSFADHPAIHAIWDGIDARIRGKFLTDTLASDPTLVVEIHEKLLDALRIGSADTIGAAVIHHIYGALPQRLPRNEISASIHAIATLLDHEELSQNTGARG